MIYGAVSTQPQFLRKSYKILQAVRPGVPDHVSHDVWYEDFSKKTRKIIQKKESL